MTFGKFLVPQKSGIFRFCTPDKATEIVVTFESAHGGIDRMDLLRQGFGEKFLLDNGYAVMSVLPSEANWYRPKDIRDFLASSEVRGHLRKFPKVHTYGSSMGAYGACAFADALGATNVIAISPVTTLAAQIVPWEKRFRQGAARDWSGTFLDGAEGVLHVESVYALYDETCPDARHVERLVSKIGSRVAKIPVSKVRHGVAVKLSAAKLLKPVILDCLKGKSASLVQQHLRDVDLADVDVQKTAPGRARARLLQH